MASLTTSLFCVLAFIFVTLLFLLANAVRVVAEYHRLVVFRLGRCIGSKGPGLVFLIPFIDRPVKVDLREQKREVPPLVMITKENIPVSISYDWYYKVTDPALSVTRIGNFELAAAGMGVTALRSMVGDLPLVKVLTRRERLNRELRIKLDEVTQKWGVKVTNIEIREIIPPKDIQEKLGNQIHGQVVHDMLEASLVGSDGETQAVVHTDGKVMIDGQSWDAVSKSPIQPAAKVRVERIILEVSEGPSTSGTDDSK
jgi:regulator of protease activity HflC (stomatin/prohibitin superfamily)